MFQFPLSHPWSNVARHAAGWVLPVVVALTGCTGQKVALVSPRAEPVVDKHSLTAIQFASSVNTRGMAGEQLVFEARLLDRDDRPIPSKNDRFRNADGDVAAGRTLMVFESPWSVVDLRVSIPAEELELSGAKLPLKAELALYRPTRERLAAATLDLPIVSERRGDRIVLRWLSGPAAAQPSRPAQQPERVARAEPASDRTPSAPARFRAPSGGDAEDATPTRPRVARNAEGPRGSTRVQGDEKRIIEPARRSTERSARTRRPESATPARERDVVRWAQPADYRLYLVREGDTLSRIAAEQLGDESRWNEIFVLNMDKLDSLDEVAVGMALRIPAVSRRP